MSFKPEIKYNKALSVEDNIKAIVNWLNFCLREMTVGRVPGNKETLEKSLGEAKTEQADTNALTLELAADHEERLCLIELGI